MKLDNDKVAQLHQKEERPIKTELRHLGSFKIYKGQQAWKMNIKTGEVTLAEYMSIDASINGKVSRKIRFENGFVYTAAINKENAERKMVQQLYKMFTLSKTKKHGLAK